MAAVNAEIRDPMREKESVFIPKVAGEDPVVWVGLNGKSWLIPRGQKVEVPKPVAEILYESERAKVKSEEYTEKIQERMNETEKNPMR